MRPQEKAVLVRQASSSWDIGASKNFRLQLSRLVSPTAWTGGTLDKAGQQCGAQLTQLRPCVKMSLTGRSCRAWCCESEHEKSLLIQLLGEASMDGHLDRLPQILRMIAAIPVVAMPPPLNIS